MSSVDHKSRKHALLSASGASRWLNCPPSARLEDEIPDKPAGSYAAEGTLAHEFGDLGLQKAIGQISTRKYNAEVKKHKEHELYSPEMDGYVEAYVEYVMEQLAEARKKTPDAVLLIEEKVDFSHYVKDGFGTNDASIIADGTLEIIDLKYGKGVKVDADDNPQLKLYALGALWVYDMCYDIKNLKLTIFQPRLDHYSSWEISTDNLMRWAEGELKEKAKQAYAGEGLQKAGGHCKWCKVNARCGTLASHVTKLAKHEFKSPHLLSDSQLLDAYDKASLLVDWVGSVKEYLLKEAIDGKQWPGMKLVAGKANRRWKSEKEAKEALKKAGHLEYEYLNTKLKGIGDVEKLVGKDKFPEVLGSYVEKPQGKPTLVPESDKRPALGSTESAKNDFS